MQSGPKRREIWQGMPVKTMAPDTKGLSGYITDIREQYPPLERFQDAYDLTDIIVSVSIPGRQIAAQMSILLVRPVE